MEYPNDDKLILLCWRHNSKALNILLKRYSGFIRAWSSEFVSKYPRIDFEELLITGLGSFLNAIKKYNIYKGNFYMYFKKIIEHQFLKILEQNTTRNNYITYSNSPDNSDRFLYLKESEYTFVYTYSKYDEFGSRFNMFTYLTEEMKNIIKYKLDGKSNKEIAALLNMNEKKVDNLYMKAKKLIKEKQFSNISKEN